MTTYRLPDALGGGEYEEYRHVDGGTEAPAGTVAFLEAGCIFTVARRLLTEVKPPPPPEPPNGSVVTCDDGYVHIRQGASWTDHDDAYASWARLCSSHSQPLTRLVPDPFVEPVELPWESSPRGQPHEPIMRSSVRVRSNVIEDANDAGSHSVAVHFLPNDARQKARALWAAADAVEVKR